jgi:hypothetical protein
MPAERRLLGPSMCRPSPGSLEVMPHLDALTLRNGGTTIGKTFSR